MKVKMLLMGFALMPLSRSEKFLFIEAPFGFLPRERLPKV
jgi:hypothetical protein